MARNDNFFLNAKPILFPSSKLSSDKHSFKVGFTYCYIDIKRCKESLWFARVFYSRRLQLVTAMALKESQFNYYICKTGFSNITVSSQIRDHLLGEPHSIYAVWQLIRLSPILRPCSRTRDWWSHILKNLNASAAPCGDFPNAQSELKEKIMWQYSLAV